MQHQDMNIITKMKHLHKMSSSFLFLLLPLLHLLVDLRPSESCLSHYREVYVEVEPKNRTEGAPPPKRAPSSSCIYRKESMQLSAQKKSGGPRGGKAGPKKIEGKAGGGGKGTKKKEEKKELKLGRIMGK